MFDFFSKTGDIPFYIFGKIHITISIITLVIIILMYIFREKIKSIKNIQKFRYIGASVLLINMIIYYSGLILTNNFDISTDLPLHFCFITNFLFIFVLFTNNKNFFKIVYFLTLIGPMPAMIFPDLVCSYNRYVFYQFIICHHFMMILSFFTLFILEYRVEKKNILKAFLFGNALILVVLIINNIIKANYIMVNNLPDHIYTILPFTKFLSPIFWLELCGISVLLLAYIPAYLVNKQNNKKLYIKE